jgi:hypothetical protein
MGVLLVGIALVGASMLGRRRREQSLLT